MKEGIKGFTVHYFSFKTVTIQARYAYDKIPSENLSNQLPTTNRPNRWSFRDGRIDPISEDKGIEGHNHSQKSHRA
jgi:hypothetical protein